MIKKTEWAEYEQRKDSFPALKLAEDDEVIGVEEDLGEDYTIAIVTKNGICLNAKTDDIPTQGRIAGGVHGISLRDGDSVAFMAQINGEGEIVIVTTEGKFKRVISSLIDPMARNRKGTIVVGLNEDEAVLYASYVTVPYMLAVVDKNGGVSELSTEDVMITVASARARKIARYGENSVKAVYALPYKKAD
jgi:topoisomerase-4 subunit A